MLKNNRGHFSEGLLREIRHKVFLSSVIKEFCALKLRAGRIVGCCPFHEEKTPSFYVDDDKGLYYCFGCSAKGDLFQFYMEKKAVPFPQAVEDLAEKAGIAIPKTPDEKVRHKKYQELYKCAALLTSFYEDVLWTRPAGEGARAYLSERGFSAETCRHFRLGFGPDRGFITAQEWIKNGWSKEVLAAVGNLAYKDGKPYDRFFGRLIFPVLDDKSRPIAFSGRVLGEKQKSVKYMNSPETDIFKKKYTVYNASVLKKKQEKLFLVEGFTDVMRIHQSLNIPAVSTMGTAISLSQIQALWKSCPTPQVVLDGDMAGEKALERLLELVVPYLEPDKTLLFSFLPSGMDPDIYFEKTSQAPPQRTLDAVTFVERLWAVVQRRHPGETPEVYAALEGCVQSFTAQIKHAGVRKYYRNTLEQYLYARTRSASKSTPLRAPKGIFGAQILRQKIIIAGLCIEPLALDVCDEAVGQVRFCKPNWGSTVKDILRIYEREGWGLNSFALVKILLRAGKGDVLREVYDASLRVHASFLFQDRGTRKETVCKVIQDITKRLLIEQAG